MAKLEYAENGRLLFSREMKKNYTILIPMMLPTHLKFIEGLLRESGYKAEVLLTNHAQIVNEGLQDVHNDTCYPALLVIGQLIDAIKSEKYDKNKVALLITQTGGGCRASNYIYLLRKALKSNELEYIPVVSLNIAGMEKNPGFKLTIPLALKILFSIIYGDLLTNLANQTRPYETDKGESDILVEKWSEYLIKESMDINHTGKNIENICDDFAKIKCLRVPKVKVGIVGEIYVKYSPLGNNNLEQFLRDENCEVIVPGLLDFMLYLCDHHNAAKILGNVSLKSNASILLKIILIKLQNKLIECVEKYPQFRAPTHFEEIKLFSSDYVSCANRMGEGWLLTGEMAELIHSGVKNVICTQPFGCLPNHIAGKGMIRKVRENNPGANIVAIDYDPGATRINQENRIKLMLAVANQRLKDQVSEEKTANKASNTDTNNVPA